MTRNPEEVLVGSMIRFRGRGHGSIFLCKCICRQLGTTLKYWSTCWSSPSPFCMGSTAHMHENSPASSTRSRSGTVPFPSLFLLPPFLRPVGCFLYYPRHELFFGGLLKHKQRKIINISGKFYNMLTSIIWYNILVGHTWA